MSTKINFNTITEEAKDIVETFANTMRELALAQKVYKEEIAPYKAKIAEQEEARDKAFADGMSMQEAYDTYPTWQEERKIKELTKAYNDFKEKKADIMSEVYRQLIPDTMFPAYKKYLDTAKRGDFMVAINPFLLKCGYSDGKGVNGAANRKATEIFLTKMGAKVASANSILTKGNFTTNFGKAQFNKLFMSVFTDILTKAGVIDKVVITKNDAE